MEQVKLEWDEALLAKYNISGPRYTSYPTALEFTEDFSSKDYLGCLSSLSEDKSLSLYIHIPFCQNICYYCACNKIITKDRSKAEKYVDYLIKEIQMIAANLEGNKLRQIHWGGGTPTYLSIQQIAKIMAAIRESFDVPNDPSTEISIEIDPRALAIEDIKPLSNLGFNRMSMGVQDFNPIVQKAVNRIQSFEMTRDMIEEARKFGFKSINLDLIYGLPFQNKSTFQKTLEQVIEISPDRISVFNYAHLPHRFKSQRRIDGDKLPNPVEKLSIFQFIIEKLQDSGYLYIGMDHFAKPSDELAIAQKNGELHRNFQGYTTHEEYQLIGVGVSSIGSIDGHYHQNVRDVDSYYAALDNEHLPSWRGVSVNLDDLIRKAVIFELICHFELNIAKLEQTYAIDFNDYFKSEIGMLAPFVEDGLVEFSDEYIKVTSRGRLLIRNICMVFDAYLNELHVINSFSKVI
ncbi:MAG: oxygen-independent coproporphyrinogen III oxidase [Kangiellaceae bacterium]